MNTTPRIYVTDLAAYNNGVLHGRWIDVVGDPECIQNKILEMLRASPVSDVEEYAIHDHENFQGYSVGEYESVQDVFEIAEFLTEFPEFGGALLKVVGNLGEARRIAEDGYCGLYRCVADYAQDLTKDCGEVPEHLAAYIDFQAMGRDWELNGDLLTIAVGFEMVHIFNNV